VREWRTGNDRCELCHTNQLLHTFPMNAVQFATPLNPQNDMFMRCCISHIAEIESAPFSVDLPLRLALRLRYCNAVSLRQAASIFLPHYLALRPVDSYRLFQCRNYVYVFSRPKSFRRNHRMADC